MIKIILHTLKNIKNTFLVVLLIKLFVLMINSVEKLFFLFDDMIADKMTNKKFQFIDSLNQFLKSMIIVKK